MRVSKEQIQLLKEECYKIDPNGEVYLFGSRLDNNKRGGDIDILILTKELIGFEAKWLLQSAFQQRFGEQKIDIVNFTFTSEDNFKKLILMDAVKL